MHLSQVEDPTDDVEVIPMFLPALKARELPIGLLRSSETGKVCSEFDTVAAAAAAEVESALTTRQSKCRLIGCDDVLVSLTTATFSENPRRSGGTSLPVVIVERRASNEASDALMLTLM